MQKITLAKMTAELIAYGMNTNEASERSRHIAKSARDREIDCIMVSDMLKPVGNYRIGIRNPVDRMHAAKQCLALYIAATSPNVLSLRIGLMMWNGWDETTAND